MGHRRTVEQVWSPHVRRTWILAVLVLSPSWLGAIPQSDETRVKSVQGMVVDLRGEPVRDARVFIRDLDSNLTRTHETDIEGVYRVNGLPAESDYEIYASYEGTESERKLLTSFLDRRDNVLNFELPIAIIPTGPAGDQDGIVLETFDRVELRASFELPEGIQAPIPAALLLHGYGEDRSVWQDLEARLLSSGWAVMALDLRGHGQSTVRNNETIAPSDSWRSDPQQFPQDLKPALDWLKTQPRLDSSRLAVIGADVGANLALVASGRFPEVATTIAINPNVEEAMALAGAGQEFRPSMVQIIVPNALTGILVREHIQGGSRVTVVDATGGTPAWLATGDTLDEIMRWLRDTY